MFLCLQHLGMYQHNAMGKNHSNDPKETDGGHQFRRLNVICKQFEVHPSTIRLSEKNV